MKNIVLEYPIKRTTWNFSFKSEIKIISLRQPRISDFIGLIFTQEAGVKAFIRLASRLSGLDEDEVGQIHPKDFAKISTFLEEVMTGNSTNAKGSGHCPNCGSQEFITERRPDGYNNCLKCGDSWR